MKKKHSEEPICSVDYAFRRIGGKYKGRIIWYLHNKIVMRYGELRKTLTDITPKMLTQTLRELEEDNLINRKVYQETFSWTEFRIGMFFGMIEKAKWLHPELFHDINPQREYEQFENLFHSFSL